MYTISTSFLSFLDNHLYPRAAIPETSEALHEPVPRPPTPNGPPTCCGGRLPASVVNKLNKLSVRSGLFKIVGEFGLRENLYYGSIFICMTLIVIVCFLVINNRGGAGLSGLISGSAAAYDGGRQHGLLAFNLECFSAFLLQNNNASSFVIPSMGRSTKRVDTWETVPYILAPRVGRLWEPKNACAKPTVHGPTRSRFAKNEVGKGSIAWKANWQIWANSSLSTAEVVMASTIEVIKNRALPLL